MRKLFIVPDGGLGNRLRAIASGIWLARAAKCEPVIVWHADAMCQVNLDDILNTEHIPARVITPGKAIYRSLFEIPRRRNLYLPALLSPMRFGRRFYDNRNLMAYCDDAPELLRASIQAAGDLLFFSGQEFFDFPRDFFRQIFHVSSDVVRKAEAILREKRPRIAVQIRRTDHDVAIENSPEDAFMEKLSELSHDDCFFLATDDEDVKARFRVRYGPQLITNATEARRDTREGIMDAMAELWIMAQTERIYGSLGSSFPEVAAWLGGAELIRVGRKAK